jgi:hypothetical protein
MGDKHVKLFERSVIQQQLNPFARCQLAFAVLRRNPTFAAAHTRCFAPVFKFLQDIHQITPPPISK